MLSDIGKTPAFKPSPWSNISYCYDFCVHQLFERQVAYNPTAIAVIAGGKTLSYFELNEQANQLAHFLCQLGVTPDQPVGICIERSCDLLIGLLAILKAGGAYVPLDPSYPPERLRFMLEDAGVRVLLTQAHLTDLLDTLFDADQPERCCILPIDSARELWATQPTSNPMSAVSGANLVYIIYTSGSTGRPKGVQIEHASLCNEILWRQLTYAFTPNDRILQISSLSFDIAAWELFAPLAVGGVAVLADPGMQHYAAATVALMREQHVTIIQMATSLFCVLLEEPSLAGYQELKHIFCGGDTLMLETVRRCAHVLPHTALHNLYGPTEATIEATCWDCDPEREQSPIPIGWPTGYKQAYVLTESLDLAAVGEVGEIYLGGVGIARGYLNRPDLTAEKFIPNPFNELYIQHFGPNGRLLHGERLYRTGDLGRYRADGAIEFLGRVDHQVKVRGYRIELGEIETALMAHPQLFAAVVVVREDTPGMKRLVAYVAHRDYQALTDSAKEAFLRELRAFLHERLPEYMVPSLFVVLDALPLTPNGKVDRAALPQPTELHAETPAATTAISYAERLLTEIWAKLLGVDHVDIHDNFFELGGDSILSIQMIAQAQQAGLRITSKQLFEHPTVAELAPLAEQSSQVQAEQGLVSGAVPLTPIQSWFFEQQFPEPHHWNQAMLFEVTPKVDVTLLEIAFQYLVMHHDALRLYFVRDDAGWQQFNAVQCEPISLSYMNLVKLPKEEFACVIEEAATQLQSSLDLSRAPRLCGMFFDLGQTRKSRLLIIINYVSIDGVSWRILLEDLQHIYQQLRQNKPVALPPKTTSYQQWAIHLRDYARSDELRQHLSYWLNALRGADPELPLDFRLGENTVASARHVTCSLSADETRAVLQDLPKAYQTQINDVLLTALLRTGVAWTGQSSLLITLESHGREELFADVDISRTVGWFTAMFPVLLKLEYADDLQTSLQAVKEQLRQIPDHGISYGLLRYLSDDAAIVEQLRELPHPQLRFNYLGQFDQVLRDGVLERRAIEPIGPCRSPLGHRTHTLVVEGLVNEGCLTFTWTYSANLHKETTVTQLAERYIAELRQLITQCLAPRTNGFSPADFELAGLNQQQLDAVAALISDLDDEEM